jgi:hypothetical protein
MVVTAIKEVERQDQGKRWKRQQLVEGGMGQAPHGGRGGRHRQQPQGVLNRGSAQVMQEG